MQTLNILYRLLSFKKRQKPGRFPVGFLSPSFGVEMTQILLIYIQVIASTLHSINIFIFLLRVDYYIIIFLFLFNFM